VFGPSGGYVGSIDVNRLVYRSTDSAAVGSPFAVANVAGSGRGNQAAAGMWGDEPDIPD
jgi:hypothetical protein